MTMRWTALFVLPLCLLLAGCTEHFAWRQKMTVTVETPAGEVSGSSVSAVSWREHLIQGDGMGWDYSVIGEAVVLEVLPGQYLFALLTGAGTTEYMGSVAAASIIGADGRVISAELFGEVEDKRDRAAGVIAVPEEQYPTMVTFADLADPSSVELVDPNDLAATFGPGAQLKAVTLEVTDEPVTEGRVEGVLGWLDAVWPNRLDGQRYETINARNKLANSLGTGWFSTEAGQ